FNTKSKINITGIDLDNISISMAKINAENYNKNHKIQIIKGDAWNLEFEDIFDIILSNGLSIYEKNPDRLVNLYKEFHKALKADGRLITSFITPPPSHSKESPWINVDKEDLKKQISRHCC
ncbi:MAG: class I SAM-dependent methyltransferase, partial [Cyanobacteria bacterium P01_D01_bin.116]